MCGEMRIFGGIEQDVAGRLADCFDQKLRIVIQPPAGERAGMDDDGDDEERGDGGKGPAQLPFMIPSRPVDARRACDRFAVRSLVKGEFF